MDVAKNQLGPVFADPKVEAERGGPAKTERTGLNNEKRTKGHKKTSVSRSFPLHSAAKVDAADIANVDVIAETPGASDDNGRGKNVAKTGQNVEVCRGEPDDI